MRQRSLVLGCLVTLMSLACGGLEPTPAQLAAREKRAADEAAERVRWDALPVEERAFCNALIDARGAYLDADGERAKATTRAERAKAVVAALPDGEARGWEGDIASLDRTPGGGHVVLVITLPAPCDPFSVMSGANMVSRGSITYANLAGLKSGDPITFDGTLVVDSEELDGFREISLTEYGSLTGGSFVMVFP